jgi:hypothetical protein
VQEKAGACDAWTNAGPAARGCWVCGHSGGDCITHFGTAKGGKIAQHPGLGALFPEIPPSRRPPDFGLHGVKNLVVGGLKAVQAMAQGEGWALARVIRVVQPHLDKARIKAGTCSHSQLLHGDSKALRIEAGAAAELLTSGGWEGMLGDMTDALGDKMDVVKRWWGGLGKTAKVSWKLGFLEEKELRQLKVDLGELTKCHVELGWKVNLWTHLWCDHMYPFARKWGGVGFFACFAVEERHKRFKRDVRHSMKGMVNRWGDNGWVVVVGNDNIDHNLLGRGYNVWSRSWTRQRAAHWFRRGWVSRRGRKR